MCVRERSVAERRGCAACAAVCKHGGGRKLLARLLNKVVVHVGFLLLRWARSKKRSAFIRFLLCEAPPLLLMLRPAYSNADIYARKTRDGRAMRDISQLTHNKPIAPTDRLCLVVANTSTAGVVTYHTSSNLWSDFFFWDTKNDSSTFSCFLGPCFLLGKDIPLH